MTSLTKKISDITGNYNMLSFPVLGVTKKNGETSFSVNNIFKQTFFQNQQNEIEIVENHITKLSENTQIHHKGNIYKIDEFNVSITEKYYFYSLTSQSVHHSFLWLKHDLLNILNPIMGFSDILGESDEISEDDYLLIKKIKNNSEKLFQQIQKLALLQNLESMVNTPEGTYEIEDFINELSNQLTANNIVDNITKNEITHKGKVNARIIQPDFRSTLEEHLEYLTSFQAPKEIKISSSLQKNAFKVMIILNNCNPPLSHIELIEEVDLFIKNCTPIKKLQISALNYLILNEICDTFGAEINQLYEENDVIVELILPALSKANKIETNIKKLPPDRDMLSKNNICDRIPEDLFDRVKNIFMNFDGLLILDDWQSVCDQLSNLNKKFQNKLLETIISDIKTGIQTFDVEKLREIYDQCHRKIKK